MALKFGVTNKQEKGMVKCLVYGRSGIGKTRLCATAPSPLILSAEKGLLSLQDEEIPFIQIDTIDDLYEAYEWIVAGINGHHKKMAKIKTICLDSITEIADQVLSANKDTEKDPRRSYMFMQEEVTKLMKMFRDLPNLNIVFVAWEKKIEGKEEGDMDTFCPKLPGRQLSPNSTYYFDEVFNYRHQKNPDQSITRFLQTKEDMQREAKDRSGRLPDAISEPNLTEIFKLISGDNKE